MFAFCSCCSAQFSEFLPRPNFKIRISSNVLVKPQVSQFSARCQIKSAEFLLKKS